jgi:hypothetical protein
MNPKLKRLIAEAGELKSQIRNLKARIKRRGTKLGHTFDPLERKRIEVEIELFVNKVSNLMLNELKCNLLIIKETVNSGEARSFIDQFDWEKAGRA